MDSKGIAALIVGKASPPRASPPRASPPKEEPEEEVILGVDVALAEAFFATRDQEKGVFVRAMKNAIRMLIDESA